MASCIERKLRLNGEQVSYPCELLVLDVDYGILKYVSTERRTVGSITLEPGTHTYATYWSGRNYNLYYWAAPADAPVGPGDGANAPGGAMRPLGWYFNIVDSVSLTPREFLYRDLVVDILVPPGGEPIVLDEQELPTELDPFLSAFIAAIKRQILVSYSTIIAEVEELLLPLLGDELPELEG